MIKTITICDKCKHEEITERSHYNDNFTDISIEIGRYNKRYKTYTLCKKCQKELGLLTEEEEESKVPVESIEGRLFNLIADIVSEVQQ